ncbi:MAG: rod shape-determining protein MreC [Candidatus Magasanikbacteria bacterium]|nr:rod shape-determining protein MreC [Candidatus Magasanikbacteria bacterium]
MRLRMAYNPQKKIYIFAGAFLAAIIVFHWLNWLAPIEFFTRRLLVFPITRFSESIRGGRIKDGGTPTIAPNPTSTIHELNAKMIMIKDENNHLREQLNFKKKTTFNLVTAHVIGRDASTLGHIIIIDRGGNDGIKFKAPVIVDNGFLIGTVIKVQPDIAHVLLLSDNQSKVAATILNRDRSAGVVEGGYGISLRLNLIPRNETVAVDDIVVSSGLDGFIPRGLLIGTVVEVENEAYKPFQQAVLTPETDLNKLTIVAVIEDK